MNTLAETLLKTYESYDTTMLKPYTPNSYVLVETESKLREVARALENFTVLGVDLENNHLDSYNGFTCLIQISSYGRDSIDVKTYVIDVLQPDVARSFREVLGAKIFENPKILKLLHGCYTSDL